MASVSSCSICHPLTKKSLYPHKIPQTHLKFPVVHPLHSLTSLRIQSTGPSAASMSEQKADDDEPMTVENLNRFVQLNVGNWSGSFYQFDANGKLLQRVSTKLAAGSYGEEELISLIQTLYIKQPQSSTSISGYDEEPGWAEYKIKESNMFTVDKYQQLGFFPNERAFALRYQTAGMLETVLRQGVLGEDDTGEESPKNLKLPSRRPSIVCENCLYSLEKDTRARAFHVLDPKGVLDMLLIFLEDRGSQIHVPPSLEDSKDDVDRLLPYLGQWKGRSVTKRSGIYGATIAEHDTVASLEIDGERQLIQDITSTTKQGDVTTNVQWTGKMSDNLVTFDKGYQLTLLPGGMYMGCPCDISKSVTESKAFHLEFCWLESPGKRQRLVRTYDIEGLAVSSTYFLETKV